MFGNVSKSMCVDLSLKINKSECMLRNADRKITSVFNSVVDLYTDPLEGNVSILYPRRWLTNTGCRLKLIVALVSKIRPLI